MKHGANASDESLRLSGIFCISPSVMLSYGQDDIIGLKIINMCLSKLGNHFAENVSPITTLPGEILGATCNACIREDVEDRWGIRRIFEMRVHIVAIKVKFRYLEGLSGPAA